MGTHILKFQGMEAAITPLHGPFLRELLDVLIDGCLQATRLRVNGSSTVAGPWAERLKRSSSFDVEEFHSNAIVLQSRPLKIHLLPLDLSPTASVLDSRRSSLDLLEESLEDALSGQEESARYDKRLMKTLGNLGRLFDYGINRIDIINGRTLSVDVDAIKRIKALRKRMTGKTVKIPGTLKHFDSNNGIFILQGDAGERVLGIVSPNTPQEPSLTELLGRPVIVEGTAEFRPSGTILRIEAKRIHRLPLLPEHESLQDELRKMVEQGQVVEARRRIEAETKAGRSQELGAWADLLELPSPVAQPRSGRGDFDANSAWLRKHRGDYQGKWVALRDGNLMDFDSSFKVLRNRLREKGVEQEVFCAKVEA